MSVKDLIFKQQELDEKLVAEYYGVNETKKSAEKYLKESRSTVLQAMERLGKLKTNVGNYQVIIVVPDASSFNSDKVLEYVSNNHPPHLLEKITKSVINEEGLAECIENGSIDLDHLKFCAWEVKAGSPRLTIKKVASDD